MIFNRSKRYVIVRSDAFLSLHAAIGACALYWVFDWVVFLVLNLAAITYYFITVVRDWDEPWNVITIKDREPPDSSQ